MRVKYTLNITGNLLFSESNAIELNDWKFDFILNEESGAAKAVVIEIGNIPEDKWPKTVEAKPVPNSSLPVFPFAAQEGSLNFEKEIRPFLTNLEGYLSVFGLESFDFNNLSVEWIPDEGEEETRLYPSTFNQKLTLESPENPISTFELASCILRSSVSESETAILAHYRVANRSYSNFEFLDAIRHLYFCIEYSFGNGEYKGKKVETEFKKSNQFKLYIREVLIEKNHEPFKRLRKKHPMSFIKNTEDEYIEFIVSRRGKLQHANTHTLKTWHPSKSGDFSDEATCLLNVVEQICWDLVFEQINSEAEKQQKLLNAKR